MTVQTGIAATSPAAPATTTVPTSPGQAPDGSPSPEEQTPVAPPATLKQPDEDFARKFAALSRREREIRERDLAIKRREEEIKAREASGKFVDKESFIKSIKEDPQAFFQQTGWTVEEFLGRYANDGKPTTEMTLKELQAEIKAMKEQAEKEREAWKAQEEARAEQEREQAREEARAGMLGDIREHCEKNAETYELIRLNDGHDLVYSVMEEHWNVNRELMDLDQACKAVEEYFEGEAKKRFANSSKIKKLYGEAPSPNTEQFNEAPRYTPPVMSNANLSATPPTQTRYLSNEESKAQIGKWLDQQLANKATR